MVLETQTTAYKPGETIPPNAYPVFRQLGIEYILQDHRHIRSVGNTVIWGQDQVQDRAFLAEPHGDGFHINRPYFEKQLRWSAERIGTQWLAGWTFIDCQEEPDHVSITCTDADGARMVITAAFVVDASGRSAILARKVGSQRKSLDRLTGYFTKWAPLPKTLANMTFIEATQDGWWYAASVSNQHLALNFMTDADLQEINATQLPQWLTDKLQETVYLRTHLATSHGQPFATVHAKPASTSHLDQLAGRLWLAVGDAACTYDPLTSYGITAALGSSLYAAMAIKDQLMGNPEAMDAYRYVQQTTFNQCLGMLQNQYNLEQRWPESAFWKRRQVNVSQAG